MWVSIPISSVLLGYIHFPIFPLFLRVFLFSCYSFDDVIRVKRVFYFICVCVVWCFIILKLDSSYISSINYHFIVVFSILNISSAVDNRAILITTFLIILSRMKGGWLELIFIYLKHSLSLWYGSYMLFPKLKFVSKRFSFPWHQWLSYPYVIRLCNGNSIYYKIWEVGSLKRARNSVVAGWGWRLCGCIFTTVDACYFRRDVV